MARRTEHSSYSCCVSAESKRCLLFFACYLPALTVASMFWKRAVINPSYQSCNRYLLRFLRVTTVRAHIIASAHTCDGGGGLDRSEWETAEWWMLTRWATIISTISLLCCSQQPINLYTFQVDSNRQDIFHVRFPRFNCISTTFMQAIAARWSDCFVDFYFEWIDAGDAVERECDDGLCWLLPLQLHWDEIAEILWEIFSPFFRWRFENLKLFHQSDVGGHVQQLQKQKKKKKFWEKL